MTSARAEPSTTRSTGRVVRILGGSEAAQPTCQVLPPNFPGYQPHCPYTRARRRRVVDAPTWRRHGSSFGKAERPVRASSSGLTAFRSRGPRTFARKTFTQLGYHFSAKRFAGFNEYFDALANAKRNGPQAGDNGWSADYPAASKFFEALDLRGGR